MQLRVHLLTPAGSEPDALHIHCGNGQQILRWLGYAAAAQLALRQDQPLGRYVPRAVLKDGCVLDVDLVLAEVAADGAELTVELYNGPVAYDARWEARPLSPLLSWETAGEAPPLPPHAWLESLDLQAEGLAALQDPVERAAGTAAGLDRVHDVLRQHAGGLQALFLLHAADTVAPPEALGRVMSLPQLKGMLMAARVTSAALPPERLDTLLQVVQSSRGALQRRSGMPASSSAGYALQDFVIALVHIAHMRFAAETFAAGSSASSGNSGHGSSSGGGGNRGSGGGGTSVGAALSTKLLSLLQECVCAHLYPEVQRRLERLRTALTSDAAVLLRKGRRLTEQLLERCRTRRARGATMAVDLQHIAAHFLRWGLLGREFTVPELALAVVHAKQPSTNDPGRFVPVSNPLELDAAELEGLLAGLAALCARSRKRVDVASVLGEMLDEAYRRAGVLLALPQATSGGG